MVFYVNIFRAIFRCVGQNGSFFFVVFFFFFDIFWSFIHLISKRVRFGCNFSDMGLDFGENFQDFLPCSFFCLNGVRFFFVVGVFALFLWEVGAQSAHVL